MFLALRGFYSLVSTLSSFQISRRTRNLENLGRCHSAEKHVLVVLALEAFESLNTQDKGQRLTPFCALQACMEGIQVVVIEIVVPVIDILVSSTGNFNISMKMLKNNAFFGNTGQFDKEIDLACSESLEGMNVDSLKPQNIFSSPPCRLRGLQNDVCLLPQSSMSSLETRVGGPCQGKGESFWFSRRIMVYPCSRGDRAGFAQLAIILIDVVFLHEPGAGAG